MMKRYRKTDAISCSDNHDCINGRSSLASLQEQRDSRFQYSSRKLVQPFSWCMCYERNPLSSLENERANGQKRVRISPQSSES